MRNKCASRVNTYNLPIIPTAHTEVGALQGLQWGGAGELVGQHLGKKRGDADVWACMFWLWQCSQNARTYCSITDNVEFEVLHQFLGVGLPEEEIPLLLWQAPDGRVCGPEECHGFVNGIVDQPKQVVLLQHSKKCGRGLMLCPKWHWSWGVNVRYNWGVVPCGLPGHQPANTLTLKTRCMSWAWYTVGQTWVGKGNVAA